MYIYLITCFYTYTIGNIDMFIFSYYDIRKKVSRTDEWNLVLVLLFRNIMSSPVCFRSGQKKKNPENNII